MATQVASLFGILSLRDEQFRRGMDNAKNQIGGVGRRLDRLGGQMQSFGAGMTVASAPIVAGFGAGINAAMGFESVMAEISARTGVVGDDLQAVSDYALEMGATTAFSGQQAADGLLELMSSGSSLEEAMATLPDVLDLAAAGALDLGNAADAVTDIMAQTGLEVADSTRIVDTLAAAASSSSASVSDLVQGFGNVGPVATQFGFSVEDTAATLAVFAENGIKGAEAGTQLRSLLLNMSRDTDGVTAAWDELGTSLYNADGSMRDFNTVLLELDTALDQLPVEEQNRLMAELAGSYGIVGLNALRGADGIGNMQNAMNNAASAGEVADGRMDTFAGSVNMLRANVETLMITALTPFMNDVLRPLVIQLTGIVGQITTWTQQNPGLTNQIIALAGAFTVAGPAIGIAGTAVRFVAGGLGMLLSPIGLVIGAVGLLAFAFLTNFGGVRTFIMEEFGPEIEDLMTAMQNLWVEVQPYLDDLKDWFTTTGGPAMIVGIREIFDEATDALETVTNLIEAAGMIGSAGPGEILATASGMDSEVAQQAVASDTLETGFNFLEGAAKLAEGDVQGSVISTLEGLNDISFIPLDGFIAGLGGPSSSAPSQPNVANNLSMEGRAGGGRVFGRRPYIVGENEPEVFVPRTNGTILNGQQMMAAHMMANQGQDQQPMTVNIYANDYEGGRQAGQGFKEEIGIIFNRRG